MISFDANDVDGALEAACQLTNRGVWNILSDMISIGKFKAGAVDILIFSGAFVNLAVIALILVKYLF